MRIRVLLEAITHGKVAITRTVIGGARAHDRAPTVGLAIQLFNRHEAYELADLERRYETRLRAMLEIDIRERACERSPSHPIAMFMC